MRFSFLPKAKAATIHVFKLFCRFVPGKEPHSLLPARDAEDFDGTSECLFCNLVESEILLTRENQSSFAKTQNSLTNCDSHISLGYIPPRRSLSSPTFVFSPTAVGKAGIWSENSDDVPTSTLKIILTILSGFTRNVSHSVTIYFCHSMAFTPSPRDFHSALLFFLVLSLSSVARLLGANALKQCPQSPTAISRSL